MVTRTATKARAKRARAAANEKWVYLFSEGNARRKDLLGGKGANLAEMTRMGLPVPPGFIVTTRACNAYLAAGGFAEGMWAQVRARAREGRAPRGQAPRRRRRSPPRLLPLRARASRCRA